jgi:hypothetical protein
MAYANESEETKLMQIGQYEMTILYYQQRREDQQWYAQWNNEHAAGEWRENLLNRIVRRLRAATQPQAQPVGDARHAHAI